MINKNGSMGAFVNELVSQGLGELLRTMPRPCFTGRAAQLIASYAVFEALLLICMPGKTFYGPVTAGGNRPVYKVRREAAAAKIGRQPTACRRRAPALTHRPRRRERRRTASSALLPRLWRTSLP